MDLAFIASQRGFARIQAKLFIAHTPAVDVISKFQDTLCSLLRDYLDKKDIWQDTTRMDFRLRAHIWCLSPIHEKFFDVT
jgi:hypothetical protein